MASTKPVERTVADLMTGCPLVVSEDDSIAGVAEILAGFEISGVPVVDADERLVGVVSETDFVRLRGSSITSTGWHGLLVRDVMTTPAKTVTSWSTVADAARAMTAERVHRLVVVDDRGTPVGVLSGSDLVREIADACDDC
jgi:CBS domain-containing protein